jgi:hypothetical protein
MSLDRIGRGGQYRHHRQRRRSREGTLPPWLISSACPRGCSAVSLSLPGSSPCRFIAFETEDNIDITSDGSHRRQDQPRPCHRDQYQGHILTDRGFRSMLIEILNSCPNLKVIKRHVSCGALVLPHSTLICERKPVKAYRGSAWAPCSPTRSQHYTCIFRCG